MNRKQRKAVVKVFEQAKKLLWDGTPEDQKGVSYICSALNKAESSVGSIIAARYIIQDRLEGYATLPAWLHGKHGICGTHEQIQAYRQAWLDELIKEFSV